jgi:hypothetical protein
MQPNNYNFSASANMAEALQRGMEFGQGFQGRQQQMRHAENADRRAEAAAGRAAASHAQSMRRGAMEMAAAEQQMARQQAFQSAMSGLYGLGANATSEDYTNLLSEFPEFSEKITAGWEQIEETQREGVMASMGEIAFALQSGNAEYAVQRAEEYAQAAENSGDARQAAMARAVAKQIELGNPDGALNTIMLGLHAYDPETAKVWQEQFGQSAKVQSTQMIGGRVSVQTMNDGTTRVVDTSTGEVLRGQAAQDAIAQAESAVSEAERLKNYGRGTGANQADIETGGAAAGAVKAGEIGQDVGLQAFEAAGQIRGNLSKIDQAIQAIDNGAKSGQLQSRVPTWNAATIELRNLQNELGLDVIGSVTFGALSEGELRLALQTALPTTLNEPDLRDWLVRKKAAQEKLLGYMEAQARFLSRPGNTLAMWLDKVDAGEVSASQTGATTPEPQPAPQGTTTPQGGADPLRDYLNNRGSR